MNRISLQLAPCGLADLPVRFGDDAVAVVRRAADARALVCAETGTAGLRAQREMMAMAGALAQGAMVEAGSVVVDGRGIGAAGADDVVTGNIASANIDSAVIASVGPRFGWKETTHFMATACDESHKSMETKHQAPHSPEEGGGSAVGRDPGG